MKVIVYGSRVRGDFRGDSDFDILVIATHKKGDLKKTVHDIFYAYELESDMSFSVTILSRDELAFKQRIGSPFLRNIKEEGIILYDAERGRKEGSVKLTS